MKPYKGIIIEESLEKKEILEKVGVLSTEIEKVTEEHKTPWIKQWTMHTVEIPEGTADMVVQELSHSLDREHNWYADFKNESYHYIVFRDKVFFINRHNKGEYESASNYGISLGIPAYQVDFNPEVVEWKR